MRDNSRNQNSSKTSSRGSGYDKRSRQRAQMISTLRGLPPAMFRTCVRRLGKGDPAAEVARWVFEQPERGACAHLSEATLAFYLRSLRDEIRRIDPNGPQRFKAWVRDSAKQIHAQQVDAANVVAIDAAIRSEEKQSQNVQRTQAGVAPQRVVDPDDPLHVIGDQLRELMEKPLRAEEFLLVDLLMNRERIKRFFKVEAKIGLPLRELSVIISLESKLIAQLVKIQLATAPKDQPLERFAAIQIESDSPAARNSAPSGHQTTVTEGEGSHETAVADSKTTDAIGAMIDKLNPAEYDRALTLSKLLTSW